MTCERRLERETGIEPATNSLEGCDSTTELLPPSRLVRRPHAALARPARVPLTPIDRATSRPADPSTPTCVPPLPAFATAASGSRSRQSTGSPKPRASLRQHTGWEGLVGR